LLSLSTQEGQILLRGQRSLKLKESEPRTICKTNLRNRALMESSGDICRPPRVEFSIGFLHWPNLTPTNTPANATPSSKHLQHASAGSGCIRIRRIVNANTVIGAQIEPWRIKPSKASPYVILTHHKRTPIPMPPTQSEYEIGAKQTIYQETRACHSTYDP